MSNFNTLDKFRPGTKPRCVTCACAAMCSATCLLCSGVHTHTHIQTETITTTTMKTTKTTTATTTARAGGALRVLSFNDSAAPPRSRAHRETQGAASGERAGRASCRGRGRPASHARRYGERWRAERRRGSQKGAALGALRVSPWLRRSRPTARATAARPAHQARGTGKRRDGQRERGGAWHSESP